MIPVRPIEDPPRDDDGMIIEPEDSEPETLIQENHARERFAKKADYADGYAGDGRTYDKNGRYNCGACNQTDGAKCLWVGDSEGNPLRVDREAGSCAKWEVICAGDPERVLNRASIDSVAYGVAANGVGFGCVRCPFQKKSKRGADSLGRALWCGEGGFRVFPTACCEYNGAKVLPLDKDGNVKRFIPAAMNREVSPRLQRKGLVASIKAVAADEVEALISTPELARDGHVLEPEGCVTENYLKAPIVLWSHDSDHPIGRTEELTVGPDGIRARMKFAPSGVSPEADKIRGLVKSGIVNAVSVGFVPIKGTPLDPSKPYAGQRYTKWELLEWSFVSIPADTGSGVTARAKTENNRMASWKVGAARNLPISDSDEWDGAAAEQAIFAHAGGDDFDPAIARKGFLFYDADEPEKRGSYKDPIATVSDGKLVVPKGAIRAALSRLPQTDVPADVKKRGEAVLKAYKKKAKIGDEDDGGDRGVRAAHKRVFAGVHQRGLFDVAQLCYALWQLDGMCHSAKVEAALEGDESEVPAMLCDVLHGLGDALKAMAEEEIDELLEAHDDDGEDGMDGEERTFVRGAKSPLARAFRYAMVSLRAGKVLSESNKDKLEEADGHHTRALKKHRSLGENHKTVGEHLEEARAMNDGAKEYHDDLGRILEGVRSAHEDGDLEEAKRCMDRAVEIHAKLGGHLERTEDAHDGAKDAHADVGDDHAALGRSIRSARRAVRAVLGQAIEGEDDDLNPESPGDGEKKDEDERSRRAKALALKSKHLSLVA